MTSTPVTALFRDKFWGSVALTAPTVVWSPMIQQWLGWCRTSRGLRAITWRLFRWRRVCSPLGESC